MREVNEEGEKNIKRYAGNDREKKRTGKSKKSPWQRERRGKKEGRVKREKRRDKNKGKKK